MSNHSHDTARPQRHQIRVTDPAPDGLHFGIGTFAFHPDGPDGSAEIGRQVIRDLVEQAVVAEQVGLDSFGIAEHYRRGMMDSAAPVILGAIASRTSTLRLGTAVTVLSTQDPVRVYNEYATLDALSSGRAQLIVGRGSAIESFPLFGFDLADYEDLFDEKLELLVRLLQEESVTWSGRFRSPLVDQVLEPRVAEGGVPVWVGVGGSPQSAIRAGRFGLPLMLGIIGGAIERFAPLTDLYRYALAAHGQPDQPVGMHVHGLIADTDEEAIERFWPVWSGIMNAEAPKRGWAPYRRDRFDAEVAGGGLFAGSAETVARRIAAAMTTVGATRFDFVAASSRTGHAEIRDNIERFGTDVVPRVRRLLTETSVASASAIA